MVLRGTFQVSKEPLWNLFSDMVLYRTIDISKELFF